MPKSFLNASSPFITEMIQVPTKEMAITKIKNALLGGATAIGIQMQVLENEYRTKESLVEIFSYAKDLPIYLTNYRTGLNVGKSDEELLEGLLLGLDCGATLIDVMGDAFNPSLE